MSNIEKKRKFLKPIGIAIAALLSVTPPISSALQQNNNSDQTNSPTATTQPSAKPLDPKRLLIEPSQKKGKVLAGHYSHSSHSSHSSHASHYSSSQ